MPRPRKLILKNSQAPGDVLMLTAAVRDLYQARPAQFVVDVRTPYSDLWNNNPYLTPLQDDDPDTTLVNCRYPLIRCANDLPYHFLEAFGQFIGDFLEVEIPLTEYRGDIHLSRAEWKLPSPLSGVLKKDQPFWLIAAGGKEDIPIKWWNIERFQAVVDHFEGRIQFVQVGAANHEHPRLRGVVDMVGKTTLRELILLVHHSEGVVCPVTLLMHLAAAVPTRHSLRRLRPCVVIAGGREPPHWEAYPGHQFIHTVGMLPCCAMGGCWKTHVVDGYGAENAKKNNLCENPGAEKLPRCMDLITPEAVIQRIEGYLEGGQCEYL